MDVRQLTADLKKKTEHAGLLFYTWVYSKIHKKVIE